MRVTILKRYEGGDKEAVLYLQEGHYYMVLKESGEGKHVFKLHTSSLALDHARRWIDAPIRVVNDA